ncbi:hypothetical protein P3T24_005910 [Paraburkholderia sp. GAS33]|jgi:hypothetical protein
MLAQTGLILMIGKIPVAPVDESDVASRAQANGRSELLIGRSAIRATIPAIAR